MKVKFQKSHGNDCVIRALANITKKPYDKIAKELPMTKEGIDPRQWVSWGLDNGLNYNKTKPTVMTMSQLGEFSKKYKGGIVARISDPAKKTQGTHTVFIRNGVVHDDVKSVDDNLKVKVLGFASKE